MNLVSLPAARPAYLAVALFVIGGLLAMWEHHALQASHQAEKQERFDALVQRIENRVKSRIQAYEYGLRGARGAVIAAGPSDLSRERFLAYSRSRDVEREFPGSRGFGFIRRVPVDQEHAFLIQARADGKPDFKIRQLAPHPGERLVIQYIEPEANNLQAVGLDVASETNRLSAALTAIRDNVATLTHPITLVQAEGKTKRGLLFMMPIFRPGMPIDTPEQRMQAAFGLAYTPLVVDEVLADFALQNEDYSLAIDDIDYANPNPRDRFFATSDTEEPVLDGLAKQTKISLYGREWQLEIKARPHFVHAMNLVDVDHVARDIMISFGLLSLLAYAYLISRQQHRQIQLDRIRLGAIVESANDAIIGKNLDGTVISWNKAAERIFGYSREEAIGHTLAELIIPTYLVHEEHNILARIASGQAQPYFETIRHRKDGSLIDVSVTASPIRDQTGKVIGAAKTVRDITVQKLNASRILELNATLEAQVEERTAELHQAMHMAEQANQAKSEFLANMSHEIRTPMNAVLGLCYLLEKQNLAPVAQDMVQKIHSAGHSLLGIINDILDFSKIEAQRLTVEQVPFRLSDVLDNLAGIMGAALGGKDIEIVVTPVPEGANFLRGDALRLGQVLINLAGNAIKFTESGEVVVTTSLISSNQDQVRLRFSVRDTGIGIAEDKQALIFKAFAQENSSTTRSFGGTGLGLTISRSLVNLMGGDLSVTSTPGKGSEFSFELTLDLCDPMANAVPEMLHQRLLIADDQPTARAVLADTAASLGWHADSVPSGIQAVERVGESKTKGYDILLLDWRMPELDGLGAAKQIREQHDQTDSPIIIMVTAYDRDRLMETPGSETIDMVLTKPVTASSLYNAVLEAKSRRGEIRIPTPVLPSRRRLEGLRMLVVDDSEINREVVLRILEGEGAWVDLAENGEEALSKLQGRPEAFDIVLMDVQMPVMDGYTATRHIRATPALAQLPVVALTAGAFKNQQEAAFDTGVNGFVAKPFNVDELIELVRSLCPQAVSAQVLVNQVNQARSALPAGLTSRSLQSDLPIDIERGLAIWHDPQAYKQFLRKFANEYGESLRDISPHTPGLQALAHKIKGAAGSLALNRVAQSGDVLEHALVSKADAAEALAQLQADLAEAVRHIAEYAMPERAPETQNAMPMDAGQIAPLLALAFKALNDDAPDTVEPLLAELEALWPGSRLQPVRAAVENFDFRGAEQAIRDLAGELDLSVEN